MDNNPDDWFLTIKAMLDDNRQYSDEKMNKNDSKLDKLTELIKYDGSDSNFQILTRKEGFNKGSGSYHYKTG